ncbi:MAG: epoxyqueuosine reductase QueH [Fibrobacter sp.]|jgi:predicted adenine nucleotide alpha hydrolase (AANH) superfamily ATPase|nr:epoxyqueuosine reductase QueH [Fibrobacter sp.]
MSDENSRPDLVLHICCAPDEAWGVHTLRDQYNIRGFFCNPNIDREEEYNLRLEEAKKVAAHYGIPLEADKYDPQSWEESIAPFADTPEGGERCRRCFLLRLRRTADFCKKTGGKLFSTVMSVSPHKSITLLNETGSASAVEYGITYECLNLKKNDGFRKSVLLSKELGLYRQDYCGCRLSRKERDLRIQKKKASSASLPC